MSSDAELQGLKADRDRFVAFAFAAADILLETKSDGMISFASGAVSVLALGKKLEAKSCTLGDIFHEDDALVTKRCVSDLAAFGRMDPVYLRVVSKNGGMLTAKLGGVKIATRPDSLFFTLSIAGRSLNGKDGAFVEVATQRYRESLDSGLDPKLSVLVLNGLRRLKDTQEPEAIADFLSRMRAVIRAYALGGDAADIIADDRIGILHGEGVSDTCLMDTIDALSVKVFDEPMGVESFSVDIAPGILSTGDAARSLAYTVKKFANDAPKDVSVTSLQQSCQAMISETMERIVHLRHAIDDRDFSLVFQPIVDIKKYEIHHFEALSRFTSGHPTQDLIELAEESGLIEDLDLVVVQMVIEEIEKSNRQGKKTSLAANVSAKTLESTIFKDAFYTTVKASGDTAHSLMVELTETTAVDDFDRLAEHLQFVRDLGVRVCLDDVGSGNTSFQTLITLPADFIKMDGELVKKAIEDKAAMDAICAIIEMCEKRSLPVIAEHIEDTKTLALAERLGINFGQGFHYGRPAADHASYALPKETLGVASKKGFQSRKGSSDSWG